jgi:hypothetical protein
MFIKVINLLRLIEIIWTWTGAWAVNKKNKKKAVKYDQI